MIMYSRLVCEFGPYAEWGRSAYPEGRKDRFEDVMKELASYFCRQTGKSFEWSALHQQMKWGVTTQPRVKNAGFAYLYILNKAAALETGFISSAELSGFVHLERSEGEDSDTENTEFTEDEMDSDDDSDLLSGEDSEGQGRAERPPELTGVNDFATINRYGHHFDGYAEFPDLASLARDLTTTYEGSRRWKGTIDELRGTLFFMLREQHFLGYDPEIGSSVEVMAPDGRTTTVAEGPDFERMERFRSLYNEIRERWAEVCSDR